MVLMQYVPVVRDEIIGRIHRRFGDFYNVDTGGRQVVIIFILHLNEANRLRFEDD